MRKNELATHLGQVPDCKKMTCPNQRRLTQIYCSIKAFCLHLLTMWQLFVNLPCLTVIAVTSSRLQDKGTTCSTAQETAGHCIYYNCNRSPNAKKFRAITGQTQIVWPPTGEYQFFLYWIYMTYDEASHNRRCIFLFCTSTHLYKHSHTLTRTHVRTRSHVAFKTTSLLKTDFFVLSPDN